ncbi:MAG TPA: undecaprenyl-diphosphate phosphatase [Limnochordales bacterium]
MDVGAAVVLGLVQGLTEFLPVSSSGHLVLVQHLLGITTPQLLFDVVVHLGTLLAVLVALRTEVLAVLRGVVAWPRLLAGGPLAASDARDGQLAAWVLVGTIPAGIVGLTLDDAIEGLFGSVRTVGLALMATAALLAVADRARGRSAGLTEVGWGRALVIGLAQAVAIIPGISRSGSTIAAGLLTGVQRDAAARFSFLLAAPTIAGAGLLAALKGASGELASPGTAVLLTGFAAAALSGYVAIRLLLATLQRGALRYFAIYVAVVGVWALVGS